jgi:hypothetical protein
VLCLLVLFCLPVPVLSMWNLWMPLCMHLLGAAKHVVASCVFVNIYPSWIDILAYCTDRCTDVTSLRTQGSCAHASPS